MRIIDANSGVDVVVGRPFYNVLGRVTVLKVRERLLSADALVEVGDSQMWTPLVVRYMHPAFRFQKVGFLPS